MPQNKSKELLQGTKFNHLTVVGLHHKDNRWRRHYLCRCDCGDEKIIQGSLLTSGNTKSCGCYGKKLRKTLNTLPNNLGVIRQIILGYKRHAKDRDLLFNLTESEVVELIKKPCHYCGLPPSNNKITKNCKGFLYSGIDRINPLEDYTISNVVPCCDKCNKSKNDHSVKEFLSWIEMVYTHSIKNAMAEQWG